MRKKGTMTLSIVLLVLFTVVLIFFTIFIFLSTNTKIKEEISPVILDSIYLKEERTAFYLESLAEEAYTNAEKEIAEQLKAKTTPPDFESVFNVEFEEVFKNGFADMFKKEKYSGSHVIYTLDGIRDIICSSKDSKSKAVDIKSKSQNPKNILLLNLDEEIRLKPISIEAIVLAFSFEENIFAGGNINKPKLVVSYNHPIIITLDKAPGGKKYNSVISLCEGIKNNLIVPDTSELSVQLPSSK